MQNLATDGYGRLIITTEVGATVEVNGTVQAEISHPIEDDGGIFVRVKDKNSDDLLNKFPDKIDAGGGQFVVPVGVVAGEVSAVIDGTVDVEVQNFPVDPASGTNQLSALTKLDSLIAKFPTAPVADRLKVVEQNSSDIHTQLSTINSKLPSSLSSDRLKVESQILNDYDTPFNVAGPFTLTGVSLIKASAGKVGRLSCEYTGGSATVYLQIHRSTDQNALSTSTLLEPGFEVGTGSKVYFSFHPERKLYCTPGICLAFSSTRSTYTAALTETGLITIYGE